jgi:hypothetical protein
VTGRRGVTVVADVARRRGVADGHDVAFFVCSDEPVPRQLLEGVDVISVRGLLTEDLYGLVAMGLPGRPAEHVHSVGLVYGDVPAHWIENVEDEPSCDSFHTAGLESGRAVRP